MKPDVKPNPRIVLVAVALIVAFLAGLGLAALNEPEQIQGDPEATVEIPLGEVVLRYQDSIEGIPLRSLTYRQVFQDALWWRVNDPATQDDTRAFCFALISALHEGRTTTLAGDELAVLMESVRIVWGPGITDAIEADLGIGE